MDDSASRKMKLASKQKHAHKDYANKDNILTIREECFNVLKWHHIKLLAWTEMEGRTAYRQHMTVFWSCAQHHVTTSLMKLAQRQTKRRN